MRDTPNHYECHICSDFNRKCTRQFIVFYFRRVLHLTVVHLRRPATVSHHYRYPVRLSMHQTRHRDARPLRTQVRIIRQVNGRQHRRAIFNVIWALTFGIVLALEHCLCGIFLAITIIGLPLATQHFKFITLAFAPFGKTLTRN